MNFENPKLTYPKYKTKTNVFCHACLVMAKFKCILQSGYTILELGHHVGSCKDDTPFFICAVSKKYYQKGTFKMKHIKTPFPNNYAHSLVLLSNQIKMHNFRSSL